MYILTILLASALSLTSPDGKLAVTLRPTDKALEYSLSCDGKTLIADSPVSLTLSTGATIGAGKVAGTSKTSVDGTIKPLFYRKDLIRERYNSITVKYKAGSIEFRAYDNAVAWRFATGKVKKAFNVVSEQATFAFGGDWNMYIPYCNFSTETLDSQFCANFESVYSVNTVSQWRKDRMSFLPVMAEGPDGVKMTITEADLVDYPGLFVYNGDGDNRIEGRLAGYPAKEIVGGHNNLQRIVTEREDYIARCGGQARSYPWRVIAVSRNDKQMLDNDIVYALGRPLPQGEDFSWVKPGKVAWEWWNNWNVRGVDFVAGVNTPTYKAYIDFAAANGIEYIIMDEGWSVKGLGDLYKVVPEIDLPEILRYGKEKGVGVILWAGYDAFYKDIEGICRHYADMGVKGFKVDFMNRDDQLVENFMWDCLEIGAKYHMMIDFHGTHKPTGLQRRWPNLINCEGIFGLEMMRKHTEDMVECDVTVPFIRFVAGFADYTQGAMRNAIKKNYRAVVTEPMSQGTRCRQLAEYVVFDSPLNMLCDSPTSYMKEPECLEFIAGVPTVWDETVALDGKVADYVAVARRSGSSWYVGAMTDWTARDITLDLSFLGEGSWSAQIWQDGANAVKFASDFAVKTFDIPADRKITVHMAPGGGFAVKIVRK